MEYRVLKEFKSEIEVEKSTFIGYVFPCDNKEEFLNKLNKIRKEHNKAKHHCYAYIIDGDVKYSDDGEPQGTAGKPLLNLLENKKLNCVAIVVVRYFGGILLGSGRLLRTYVACATSTLDSSKLATVIEEKEVEVEIDIDYFNIFKNYLIKSNFLIKETEFNDKIRVVFFVPLNFIENLESKFFPKLKVLCIKNTKNIKEVD